MNVLLEMIKMKNNDSKNRIEQASKIRQEIILEAMDSYGFQCFQAGYELAKVKTSSVEFGKSVIKLGKLYKEWKELKKIKK